MLRRSKLIFLFVFCAFTAQASDIKEIFEEMSDIENPLEIRDPFQPPNIKQIRSKKNSGGSNISRNYSNIPILGKVDLDTLKITGVIVGPQRRAFAKKGNDKVIYTIKEGMKLGENNAEVKAILPGGIILVEKITNIYGEVEFLETVIPLSK